MLPIRCHIEEPILGIELILIAAGPSRQHLGSCAVGSAGHISGDNEVSIETAIEELAADGIPQRVDTAVGRDLPLPTISVMAIMVVYSNAEASARRRFAPARRERRQTFVLRDESRSAERTLERPNPRHLHQDGV